MRCLGLKRYGGALLSKGFWGWWAFESGRCSCGTAVCGSSSRGNLEQPRDYKGDECRIFPRRSERGKGVLIKLSKMGHERDAVITWLLEVEQRLSNSKSDWILFCMLSARNSVVIMFQNRLQHEAAVLPRNAVIHGDSGNVTQECRPYQIICPGFRRTAQTANSFGKKPEITWNKGEWLLPMSLVNLMGTG